MANLYKALQIVARPILALLYPIKVTGERRLPQGGTIVVSNHISNWDVIVLGRVFDRQIHFMAKKELFDNKFMKPLVTGLGAYPVDRGSSDMGAIRTSLKMLSDGDVIGIFPQGTRVKDDNSFEMANGVSMIAIRSGANVLPVHIVGPYKPFRRLHVHVGESFKPCEAGARVNKELIESVSAGIAWQVQNLKKMPDSHA